MAISIDYLTKVITVPQADCTFVSGTFYRLPTKTVFKAQVDALMDNAEYMWMPHPIDHNTQYTVVGTTYAPKIEVVNGYTVEFTPNSAWTVELTESNTNIHDVGGGILVQNQVQVIPTNSAGLVYGQLTAADIAQLFDYVIEGTETFAEQMRLIRADSAGRIIQAADGSYNIRDAADSKNRISGDDAANGGRDISATDGT